MLCVVKMTVIGRLQMINQKKYKEKTVENRRKMKRVRDEERDRERGREGGGGGRDHKMVHARLLFTV